MLSYEGVGATLVRRLKFANHRDALGPLAAALAGLLETHPETRLVDSVTWVPTTARRRRERGFDQAQLLAVAVATELGMACRASLRRLDTTHQVGRGRLERLAGPTLVARSAGAGARWLVVDDVVTTGATMTSAATALLDAGAASVVGAALARTA